MLQLPIKPEPLCSAILPDTQRYYSHCDGLCALFQPACPLWYKPVLNQELLARDCLFQGILAANSATQRRRQYCETDAAFPVAILEDFLIL